ncbi:hypothetical protein MASR2M18_20530 [Ignavibacteria bacterium]|nr:tetratricopeptide repeat-containing sensor histidine kinase [Bacteroidota bacterium]
MSDKTTEHQTKATIGEDIEQLRLELASVSGATKLNHYYKISGMLQRIDAVESQAITEEGLRYAETLEPSGAVVEGMALLWIRIATSMIIRGNIEAAYDAIGKIDRLIDNLADNGTETKAMAKAENVRGLLADEQGRQVEAITCYEKALSISTRNGYLDDEYSSLVNIGNTYSGLEQYPQSIEMYLRALDAAERLDDLHLKGKVYNNMSIIYARIGDKERQMEFCNKAYTIYCKAGDLWGQSLALSNIAELYYGDKDFDSSYKYLLQAHECERNVGNLENFSVSLSKLADVCEILEKYDEAFEYITQAVEYALSSGSTQKYAITLADYSHFLRITDRCDIALETVNQALSICREHGHDALVSAILEEKYEILKKLELWREAAETAEQIVRNLEIVYDKQAKLQRDIIQTMFDLNNARDIAELERKRNEELAAKDKELRTQNKRLEILNEEKNELLRIVAHDLKNPLSAVNISAKMLRDMNPVSYEDKQELCKDILSSSERMSLLINDLLNIEELERGTLRFRHDRVNAAELAEAICRQNSLYAVSKNIKIHCNIRKDAVYFDADENRLRQVIENLLSNAIKFSPYDSSVAINISHTKDRGRITVRDHGPGITDADKERLFQKFARLSARPTGGEHSTGLGLAIVKKITDAMGGTVRCESEVGNGTEFIVELPLAAEVEDE